MRSAAVLAAVLALSLAVAVSADVYMHAMRGGNNRLNEGGPGRNNGNRLWDSQNNNRGGYNAGSIQRQYYYEGTVVPIEWTQQHSCGDQNGNACEIILQYTCHDQWIRDGTTTDTIPRTPAQCQDATTPGDCDLMTRYGRHESWRSYEACRYRSRNKGLFTSNQNLQGNSARFTRQNNDGDRSGLECPEERDYYPYWHPSIWKDVAILTNRPERCAEFQANSQNVAQTYYCHWDPENQNVLNNIANNVEGWVPITETQCKNAGIGGQWTPVAPNGQPAPECILSSYTRDNHLGNAMPGNPDADTKGFPSYYNWTIPADYSANCVFRLRYNISTGEFPNQGYASQSSLTPALDKSSNMVPLDGHVDNNARYPSNFPIWEQYGLSYMDVTGSFTARVQNDDPNDDNNGGRAGGIKKSQPPSRDYTLRNNPQVDMFGDLLPRLVSTDAGLTKQAMIRTRLAINTAQYGRTFEDRTHVFEIRERPANLRGVKIWNLSVRGKKGNIVQTYPGVEYDFVPDRLHVEQGDMVHIQWTGSIPQGGEGQGNAGDRQNIIMLRNKNYEEVGQSTNTAGTFGHLGNAYPGLINDTSDTAAFLGLDFTRLRMLALYGLNSSHFDMGPVQAATAGAYYYLCTRNNAFSNRSQKGLIVVKPNPAWVALGAAGVVTAPTPVSVSGETWATSGLAKLAQAGDFDGTLVVPGSVTVSDTHRATWYRVDPPIMNIGVDQGDVYLEAERPQSGNFFMKGQMNWKLNEEDSSTELIPTTSFYAARQRFSVTNGGYYQSTSVPNSAMIAGVLIGCIGLISILVFLYWKVRVQPEGGWKAFCAKGKKGADTDAAHEAGAELSSPAAAAPAAQRLSLIGTAAPSSSSNQV